MSDVFGRMAQPSMQDDEDDDYNFDNTDVGSAKGSYNRISDDASSMSSGTAAFRRAGTSSHSSRYPRSRMGQSRALTSCAGSQEGARPMTASSLRSKAGFKSKSEDRNPMKKTSSSSSRDGTRDDDPTTVAKRLENQTHRLIEDSTQLVQNGDLVRGLEKAKEAGKKERLLVKHREANSLPAEDIHDLSYATWFHLAAVYEKNDMYQEAINAYSYLVKQKKFRSSWRARVNMGNIYYVQKDYAQAVKMYRMALDQIPQGEKQVGYKICRNVGNAFVKLGKYRDAVQSYEAALGATTPDSETCFNLLLCHLAMGDGERSKRTFLKLTSLSLSSDGGHNDGQDENDNGDEASAKSGNRSARKRDDLQEELLKRRNTSETRIMTAARLVAPIVDSADWAKGYHWVNAQVKETHERLACLLEIEEAVQHLRRKQFKSAIKILKGFERKDPELRAVAATNLSFVYFLEGDNKSAEKHAHLAVKACRYNAKALVNTGNCFFATHEFEKAKELYLEAIGVQADCVQAIFNLGVTNMRLDLPEEAGQAFEKLHDISPNNPDVIYHIANLYEQQGHLQQAIKWLNVLVARIPSDPGTLARLGHVFTKMNDDNQGYHYLLESYRQFPSSLDVISYLGVHCVKNERYEASIELFERAAQLAPHEVKWQLMVASCWRREGNQSKALQLYEDIHTKHPTNAECLRYLIGLCKDVGDLDAADAYQDKKACLDRPNPSIPSQVTTRQQPRERQPVVPSPVPKASNHGSRAMIEEKRDEDDSSDDDVNALLA